jgi:hypothetical protein
MVKEIYQDGKGDLKEITKNSLRNLKLMNFQLRINTLLNFWRRNIWRKEGEKGDTGQVRKARYGFIPCQKRERMGSIIRKY